MVVRLVIVGFYFVRDYGVNVEVFSFEMIKVKVLVLVMRKEIIFRRVVLRMRFGYVSYVSELSVVLLFVVWIVVLKVVFLFKISFIRLK